MFERFRNWFSAKRTERRLSDARPVRVVRAKYDAAQTTTENANHWANADNLSADSANSLAVRKKLRERARYEVANNSYARGIILTLANDTVGTGPRLQMLSPDAGRNREIEARFAAWASARRLPEKLRTMRMAKCVDGEAFGVFYTNADMADEVSLDVRLVESDQVSTPYVTILDPLAIDGLETDAYGNVTRYAILRYHPGDTSVSWSDQADWWPASSVLHLFRMDRPGQHRGVPEIAPALPLFAELRRYTLATIAAAEVAADLAVLLHSDMPPDGSADLVAPLDTVPYERRMMTTLPMGWDATQIKPEHPSTVYGDFIERIINEIARCLNIPLNVALCNSSKYNYASGRLDHQVYFKSILVEQKYFETAALDRIFRQWFREAAIVYGWDRTIATPHQWFWDGYEHVDPSSEADALATRLACGATTLPAEYARAGLDWEAELATGAKAMGVTVEEYQALIRLKTFGAAAAVQPSFPPIANGSGKSNGRFSGAHA